MLRRGKPAALVLFVVFMMLVTAGIARDEIPDVVSNATIICLSCIGLK